MNNKDNMINLIKKFSGQANLIAIPKVYIDLTGNIVLAAMLSQLIYWSDRSVRPDKAVYKSLQDWKDELNVSDYSVRQFKLLPYIKTFIQKANGVPTTHYLIDFDLLISDLINLLGVNDSISSFQRVDQLNSTDSNVVFNDSLTEITTEITHQTTTETLSSSGDDDIPPISTHSSLFLSLSKICNLDPNIKSNRGRLNKIASQLAKANYLPDDIYNFFNWWMSNDWRYKKNKQLPTPENVISLISQSKSNATNNLVSRSRYNLWLK